MEKRLRDLRILAIKVFDSQILKTSPISIGLHLRGIANRVKSAMEVRDVAVRGGATGATIILFKEGRLEIPSVHPDFLSKHPSLAEEIHESFNLEDSDIIIIISAEDECRGFEASLTIANNLLPKQLIS